MSPYSLNYTQISICNILTTYRLSFVHNGTEYAQIAKVQATANCKFASNLLTDFLQIKHNMEFVKKQIKHFHMLLQNILFVLFCLI